MPRQTRYRDTKTGKLVKQSTWKRSKAQGGTRYKRVYIKSKPREVKALTKEFQVRYKAIGKKAQHKFFGEMIFSAPASTTEEQRKEISKKLLKGEKVAGVEFKKFNYSHHSDVELNSHILEQDDLDFDFLWEDDGDNYFESSS